MTATSPLSQHLDIDRLHDSESEVFKQLDSGDCFKTQFSGTKKAAVSLQMKAKP